jgi:hypothetical protein
MFLRESKIPFSDSSNPRASELLQKKEALDTSIIVSKDQIQIVDQQTHLLRGVLQNESLRPDKLWDNGLSRSTLPLSEPFPPDSAGAAGVESAGLTTEPTACLLEGEGGLKRGKTIKIKRNTSERQQEALSCHYSQRRRSVSESSQTRWLAHPPSTPGHLTPSDLPKDLQTKFNCDLTRIQRHFQTRIQGKRRHMHT